MNNDNVGLDCSQHNEMMQKEPNSKAIVCVSDLVCEILTFSDSSASTEMSNPPFYNYEPKSKESHIGLEGGSEPSRLGISDAYIRYQDIA